ncbi:MAG TPA: M20 family metallopeptidase [Acidimicrobiales bacterium]|nr:M20 family metallopeptidase [Acidimicrobiales bacterium]
MDRETAKRTVVAEVDRRADDLLRVSHEIHAHPELAYEEHFAHDVLTAAIAGAGLPVTAHAYGLDTAFASVTGPGDGPLVAVLCEYDALPGIGHACGHNIIAAAGLGAGLAVAAVAETLGGRIMILGTPAEEGGGGKQKLIDAGAFAGVQAAMMVHPASADLPTIEAIAIHQLTVRYFGRAAHAAASPWQGTNALDAAVLGYMNIAALRQHILPSERLHGVFLRAGDKPNIVPDRAESFWYVRSKNLHTIEPLRARVLAALEAGAIATGCTFEHEWGDIPYADMIDNAPLLGLYTANAAQLGRVLHEPDQDSAVIGSTDMGNVSYSVPAIHPMIKAAPQGCAIHTKDFAVHAASPLGDQAVLDGAKAMAMTVVDFWLQPGVREAARAAFDASMLT